MAAGTDRSVVEGNFADFAGAAVQSISSDTLGYILANALPGTYSLPEAGIQTVTWYDTYDFLQAPDFASEDYGFADYPLSGFSVPETTKRKGLVTGTWRRVLVNTNDDVTDSLLLSINYYDDFGRPTRIISITTWVEKMWFTPTTTLQGR